MIPTILISHNPDAVEEYIASLMKTEGIVVSSRIDVKKETASLTIEQIRQLQSQLVQSVPGRLIVIHDYHTAKQETQNSLLKLLEEHDEGTSILLVTADESMILPTVISRCKVVKLIQKQDAVEQNTSTEPLQGTIGKQLLAVEKITKEEASDLIVSLIHLYERKLIHEQDTSEVAQFLHECIETYSVLIRNNVNPQACVDHLLLLQSKLQ